MGSNAFQGKAWAVIEKAPTKPATFLERNTLRTQPALSTIVSHTEVRRLVYVGKSTALFVGCLQCFAQMIAERLAMGKP